MSVFLLFRCQSRVFCLFGVKAERYEQGRSPLPIPIVVGANRPSVARAVGPPSKAPFVQARTISGTHLSRHTALAQLTLEGVAACLGLRSGE